MRALTPPSLRAEITRRHNPIVPWVGIIKEEIEPGQGLDSIAAQGIAARLEEMQMLLLQLRDVGRRLPSGLRRSLAETLTRATSAYFSSLNIPHSVERFSSVLGQKHWRIKVAAQAGSVIPIVEMANRLAASDVSL
ncbi:MAG: hypothetical protein ACXWQE_07795, partial [Bdellovibrionales bacterium]